ncbi:hypothetical protein AAVH_26487, partial [Aphelenchoides avenae]
MIAIGAISIELSEESVLNGVADAHTVWTIIRNVLSKECGNPADETDVTTQAELKEMARVLLDLVKSGASWEVVILRSVAKWLGMKGLRRIVAKLYASFVEWFCENDDEQVQLYDFARYAGAFMEIVMVLVRYVGPLLGIKIAGGCGLLVGVA